MIDDVLTDVSGEARTAQAAHRDALLFAPMSVPPVRGRVVEATTGLPLAGAMVRWVVPTGEHDPGRPSDRVIQLGEARSGEDGAFEISLSETPEAQQAACGLAWSHDVSYLVLSAGEPVEVKGGSEETVISVAQETEPDQDAWRSLAVYLAANRMHRVDELSRQLSTPFLDSPVNAWPVQQRAAALAVVRRSLTDGGSPTEESSTGMALLEQEHLLNLEALHEGNVFKALNNYRSVDTFVEFGGRVAEWYSGAFFKLPKSDLELYRDYLRGVWVTAARQMHKTKSTVGAPAAMPSDAALETQLDTRFHQNFYTPDVTPQAAHKLLIPILREVLTARADRDGFGVSPASIPAQGTASDEEYVAKLIAMTGVSVEELRNRFRIRFDRFPGEQVSPVQVNVEALLGLLADTYQSPEEPFPAALRGVEPGRPLIFPPFVGRAPFFLQYEEWLDRQRRFYPENVYDIRRAIPVFDKEYRDEISGQKTAVHANTSKNNDYIANQADWQASAAWMEHMFAITDEIRAALASADKQLYGEAHAHFDAATARIFLARKTRNTKWVRDQFPWVDLNGNLNKPSERRVGLKARAGLPVNTPGVLAAFEAFFDTKMTPKLYSWENAPGPDYGDWLESWLARARTLYVNELDYLEHVLIPYLRSTIFVTLGDHARALKLLAALTGYQVGVAQTTDAAGYRQDPSLTLANQPLFYASESLPYTTGLPYDQETRSFNDGPLHWSIPPIAPFERRFFKLAQGDVMLAWADELYRTDEPSAIRRARELYKGVIFMHGEDPEIAPRFDGDGQPFGLGQLGGLDPLAIAMNPMRGNPARTSQLARARAGFWQIEQGLNAYGYRADMVPVLRYKPLKQAADLFGTSAKSAQADFLQYQTRFEQAQIEGWQTAAMVKKAEAGAGIAAEHIEIAKTGVAKAQEQVTAVKAQIEAKKKEIAEADSFFGQAKDFFGGMKDSLTGMVPLAEKVMKDQSPAGGSVSNEQLLAMLGKSTGGASAAKDAAAATLGSGAALTVGFAAFAYYGYTTMEGMAEAAAKRSGDLKALQNVALPAAEAQVRLKERDVTIAKHQQQIAQTELDLARTLDRYQRDRFLNVDLWNKLAAFAHRTMKRYIELGARAAWLAERALAFEQNREIGIVRLNYVPTAMRGLTGADRLLLDLAELEANRLQGVRLTAPVKHTISLARDFPVAFGQLKKSGRCTFHTAERPLQLAYPGTYAYRVRAVTVAAQDADGPPPRGILRNLGASIVSKEDGTAPKVLVRFPDALPLSEFRLHDDLWVYGLPGETLLQFEGSGLETDWELEFPAAANAKGLRSLIDVMITCDMNAMYSQALATEEAAAPPVTVAHSIALAASVWDAKGLATLRATSGPAQIRFDLTKVALPAQEKNRQINNLAVLAVGKTEQVYAATLDAELSGVQAAFDLTDGVALSNAGPLLGGNPPLPLNDLVDAPLDQAFVLEIDRTGVADELRALYDVVLYLEYRATL